jgi:hypothetical protein
MAYAEMMQAVKNLLAYIPPSCGFNALNSPPWSHPDVPMTVSSPGPEPY